MLNPKDQANIDAFDRAAAVKEARKDARPTWMQLKAGRSQQADTNAFFGATMG